ncbi:acyl-CoA thioesterase [Bdellovibrio bacteriovorus]
MSDVSHYNITIKEYHVDSYGHVNNATYLQIYEEARWELITSKGYGFHEVHQLQQGPVILEVNVKFFKEIPLRSKIDVTTEVMNYKGKVGQLLQKMIKEDGTVASEAIFTFGLFDMKARKLIEPTEKWKKALGI